MGKKLLWATAVVGLLFAGTTPTQAAVITHEEVHIQYTWEEFFAQADGSAAP